MKEKNSMVEENGFKYGWGKEVDVEINSPNLFPHLYLSKLRHQEGRTRELACQLQWPFSTPTHFLSPNEISLSFTLKKKKSFSNNVASSSFSFSLFYGYYLSLGLH